MVGLIVGTTIASAAIYTMHCREMKLDAGWAGIVGALVGVLGTLAVTYLNHCLQNRRTFSLAEKRRARLHRELESKKYIWRSIERLAAVIGADENVATELLIEIGARASMTSKKVWALETRAPFPDDEKAEGH